MMGLLGHRADSKNGQCIIHTMHFIIKRFIDMDIYIMALSRFRSAFFAFIIYIFIATFSLIFAPQFTNKIYLTASLRNFT